MLLFMLMNVFIHNMNGSSLFYLKHDFFFFNVIVIISFLNVNDLHVNNSFS